QTVHADFPHTAYQWSVGTQHYTASCFQKGCSESAASKRRISPSGRKNVFCVTTHHCRRLAQV
ncbi:MAG TPA: hypothetical protein PKA88_13965, partial [Polyangiaceae bacterium]|nr:hypothetical protein [Polyangiaceae bacterium]